jgi:hypothetical protein
VVLNSEQHPWLRNFKPDFVVLPDAFWLFRNRNIQGNMYKNGKFGIVSHSKVFGTVRCVIDGKIAHGNSTFDNDARGQLKDYAISLCNKVHGDLPQTPHDVF